MKIFLYLCALALGLSGCWLAGGCASHRLATDVAPTYAHQALRQEPYAAVDTARTRPLDSTVVVPHRSLLDKVLGRQPQAATYVRQSPARVGKKATINNYYGPATVTTVGKKSTAAVGKGAAVAVVGKKGGPLVQADSGATVQVASSKQGPAAASGRDASASQTTEKKSLLASLLPAGAVLGGIGLVYWLVLGGGLVWVAGLFKRREADKQA